MLSRIAARVCRPSARGFQYRNMMTQSKPRQAVHADETDKVFSSAHPEDLVFAKRTVGATVVGGSGIFALSHWWKQQQKKKMLSIAEAERLGTIHIGHIGGLTKEVPLLDRKPGVRSGVTKDIHTGGTRDLSKDLQGTREVFNGVGISSHELEQKAPARTRTTKLGTFTKSTPL